jgi:hypothetical protein
MIVSASGNVHWSAFARLTEPSPRPQPANRSLPPPYACARHAVPKTYVATLIIAGLLLASAARASSYTGKLSKVASQPSPAAPTTQVRVSIFTATAVTTACASASLYSFDLSNAAVASSYQAILLASLVSGTAVTISGSGICDPYGIEEVAGIYLN